MAMIHQINLIPLVIIYIDAVLRLSIAQYEILYKWCGYFCFFLFFCQVEWITIWKIMYIIHNSYFMEERNKWTLYYNGLHNSCHNIHNNKHCCKFLVLFFPFHKLQLPFKIECMKEYIQNCQQLRYWAIEKCGHVLLIIYFSVSFLHTKLHCILLFGKILWRNEDDQNLISYSFYGMDCSWWTIKTFAISYLH